jgi:hypothetical protein
VIPTLVGVPIARALLVIAIDLADETIHIDNESILTRSRPCCPGPLEAVSEYPVELADVPESERTKKRPQRRRRRDPMPSTAQV